MRWLDIRVPELVEAVAATNFPLADAALAMQQHLAPRIIQVAGLCSALVCVNKSILAGCFYSIPLVELYLDQGNRDLEAMLPQAHHRTYVDDTSHLAFGERQYVIDTLVHAAEIFKYQFVQCMGLIVCSLC